VGQPPGGATAIPMIGTGTVQHAGWLAFTELHRGQPFERCPSAFRAPRPPRPLGQATTSFCAVKRVETRVTGYY
jgi:hypothetical protein